MGGGWGCQWHAGEPPGLENSFKWGLVFPFHSLNRNTLNKRLDIESLAFYPAGKYTLNLQCHVLFRFQYFFQSLEIYNHLNSTKPLETTTISSDWTLIPLTKDHSSRFIKSLNPHWTPSCKSQGLHLYMVLLPFQAEHTLLKKKEYLHHHPSATALALFYSLSVREYPKSKLLIFHMPVLHSPTTTCMLINTLGNSSWSPVLCLTIHISTQGMIYVVWSDTT